jgi:Transposase DDE domain group 1
MSRPSPWPDEALIRASPQGIIAYNLGNLLRRLVRPVAIRGWSLTSLQQRLLKTGGRLIRPARSFVLQLAESYLTGSLFRQILGRIERLVWHPT